MSSDSEPYGLNEVDEFHKNKAKITFDNSTLSKNYKNTRQRYDINSDEDLAYSDEDVMSINEENSQDESDKQDDDQVDSEDDEQNPLDGATVYKKLFGKKLRSVEEVEELDEDDENNWGSSKSNYYGADDVSDNEDDAKAMEEEAKKQQQSHMESLNMMDFMDLDDETEQKEWSNAAKEYDNKAFEVDSGIVQIEKQNTDSIASFSEKEKLEFLRSRFPEFTPLYKEYKSINQKLENVKSVLSETDCDSNQELFTVMNMKKSAYLSNLASMNLYFFILLKNLQDPDNEEFKNMKYHPIMEKILLTKEIVRQADSLPETYESNTMDDVDEDEEISELDEDILANAVEEENEDQLMEESKSDEENSASEEESEIELESRVIASKVKKDKSDFIEDEINDIDLAEKNQKKKSLRFYTAKIDKSDRQASDKLVGGDDDIPYKERMFERKQRLLEEARQRGLQKKDDFAKQMEEDEDIDMDKIDEINNYNSKEIEDFYSSVSKSKSDKKQSRQEAHKLAKQAATEGKLEELAETLDEDGKRAINYQILKNKGLTPHRHKDNRNSRVKKRKKYEKAQKKLRSMKQVYQGPHNGRYEGEKSGIRKDISKSTKL
ncbi:related to Something about silencing protein 10 [Hanseniaspora guilliermondii]|uniref:Related to Something about silencing protein 10 n=1 Tax=Hanseniaspora guilliermondii TaxID=56406 RepID=A0A1L0AX42_9ASCO|nr:related to Something about silencing protein 10 [Hanseniaspora guilliermondii]